MLFDTKVPATCQPPGVTRRPGNARDMTSFGHRHSLLGHPIPAGELGPPHGRLTEPRVRTPNGVTAFRTHELRPGWAPSLPRGRRCSSRTGATSRPAPAASLRLVPFPPPTVPPARMLLNEASTKGSHVFARPVFPSPVAARMERAAASAFPRASHPADQEPTTHAEVETGHRARTWNYSLNITFELILQSCSSLTACDLASHIEERHSPNRRAGISTARPGRVLDRDRSNS